MEYFYLRENPNNYPNVGKYSIQGAYGIYIYIYIFLKYVSQEIECPIYYT